MISVKWHRLGALSAFLVFASTALAAKVASVQVKGNARIEADAIMERMQLKKGAEITADAARADTLSIFELGYFEDVRILESGGALTVQVRERPVVEKIRYEGASEFETKELEETSGLKPFKVLNLGEIQEAKAKIIQRYEEKGYYLASAEHEVVPGDAPGSAELVIRVFENDRVRIRKIFFLGNKVYSAAELKQVMQSAEGHFFSWATSGGTYREEVFERDLAMLAFFYGNSGYIQAKFAKPRVTLSQDRRYVDMVIDVDEGPQFRLGEVEFAGDLLFEEKELRDSFEMKKNDIFSTGVLQGEIIKLTDKYGDQGYAFANVIPRPRVQDGKSVVDLGISVEPGEKAYWGKISVTGNTKTHDKVLRRELPFNEGELYNATKRKKGFERIQRLGFFGSDVNFLTSSPDGKTNVIDLEIKVEEKPTGSLNVSAGYGNASGFIFGAQVAQNNLFGLGRQLSFNMNLSFSDEKDLSGTKRSGSKTFSLTYVDPHINDSDYSLGMDLMIDEYPVGVKPKTYDKRSSGGSMRLGKELRESLFVYSGYRFHHTLFRDVVNPQIFTNPDKDKESYVSSLSLSLEYDTRNNRLDPSGGMYLSTSGEVAGLGGRKYMGWNASGRYYQKLFWSFVYRTRLDYGVLFPYGGDTVPDSQRYILGGIQSLRGYDSYTVGPTKHLASVRNSKEAALGARDYVLGGSQKIVMNHEIEFTLIPEANIRGVVFFDAGNAWNGTMSKLEPAILSNYGWGIRWYSPLGPLRFEWGYPLVLSDLKRDYRPVFNFMIAPSF
ncbi:MAG TPA: outer membrane protein assembly factor BamA [Bdellovibrionota bacterium]|jgi:outer membrane protein insertion porin family|nr:outer membrane protein assembly factor BamA [Bdellovibrionota bacterium]